MTRLCILAGNYEEALTFAKSQNIDKESWFYPASEADLKVATNFYVLVVGSVGFNIPIDYFNKIYTLAQLRGRIGRK